MNRPLLPNDLRSPDQTGSPPILAARRDALARSITRDHLRALRALPQSSPTRSHNQFSALNMLIANREAIWSQKARALKFDVEFKAVEQERRRVAKELHDDVLPLISRLLRAIRSHEGRDGTDTLIEEANDTIYALRDLLGDLHPVDLEELGLVAALSNICKRYARRTKRSVTFIEQTEECGLSDLQQLCLYRAVQIILAMSGNSQNDLLVVQYHRTAEESHITIHYADKRVSASEWLSAQTLEFDTFRIWCGMAGASIQYPSALLQFNADILISISDKQPEKDDVLGLVDELTQVRLEELDNILAIAQEEWATLFKRDCSLFRDLAIEVERKRISQDIATLIVPRLERIADLAEQFESAPLRLDVVRRMQIIAAGVRSIMSELYPRLLAKTGLVSSIKSLVARFRRATLIETNVELNSSCASINLPIEAKFAIYRVTQEALNNVEKHSDATHALVTLKLVADELVICIEDNGKGFQQSGSTLSRGLKNIRERASEIGAKVAWQRSHSFDTGTSVSISLSVKEGESGIIGSAPANA